MRIAELHDLRTEEGRARAAAYKKWLHENRMTLFALVPALEPMAAHYSDARRLLIAARGVRGLLLHPDVALEVLCQAAEEHHRYMHPDQPASATVKGLGRLLHESPDRRPRALRQYLVPTHTNRVFGVDCYAHDPISPATWRIGWGSHVTASGAVAKHRAMRAGQRVPITGFRTMWNPFHHRAPDAASACLLDAWT
jgi:hypothetical protein